MPFGFPFMSYVPTTQAGVGNASGFAPTDCFMFLLFFSIVQNAFVTYHHVFCYLKVLWQISGEFKFLIQVLFNSNIFLISAIRTIFKHLRSYITSHKNFTYIYKRNLSLIIHDANLYLSIKLIRTYPLNSSVLKFIESLSSVSKYLFSSKS